MRFLPASDNFSSFKAVNLIMGRRASLTMVVSKYTRMSTRLSGGSRMYAQVSVC